jgi:uncharacterized membrane protein
MVEQFSDDPFVVNSSMTRARISFQTIFVSALNDYRTSLLNSFIGIESNNKTIDIIALVVLVILLIFLYLIIVRLEHKMRVNENEVFNVIGCIRDQQ